MVGLSVLVSVYDRMHWRSSDRKLVVQFVINSTYKSGDLDEGRDDINSRYSVTAIVHQDLRRISKVKQLECGQDNTKYLESALHVAHFKEQPFARHLIDDMSPSQTRESFASQHIICNLAARDAHTSLAMVSFVQRPKRGLSVR